MLDDHVGPRNEPNPINSWLFEAAALDASDLHLIDGYPPMLRIHGQLKELDTPATATGQRQQWMLDLVPKEVRQRLDTNRNVDFALQLSQASIQRRFRANYFYAADKIGACFRVIPENIPDLEWAGFPRELAEKLTSFRNGLVISCGVTGAGKTTTLAMLLKMLCESDGYRIITIEEPIEYVFPTSNGSVVTQREIGRDVLSFDEGLMYSLRQDPDVILVGEIRDRETAQTALRAAETGHLVFASLHTRDAKGAISRYADFFSQDTQQEIRSQLSVSLRAVISQHLLPSAFEAEKRELALEVMFNNSPISVAIRQGRLDSIDNAILTGRADGMIPLNESIRRLYQSGNINRETAELFSTDARYLKN